MSVHNLQLVVGSNCLLCTSNSQRCKDKGKNEQCLKLVFKMRRQLK